jgi:hypothetical protein
VNIYSLNVCVVNLKWKFIYLGRRPSPSPLLSPDVLADVDVVDLKLSNIPLMALTDWSKTTLNNILFIIQRDKMYLQALDNIWLFCLKTWCQNLICR